MIEHASRFPMRKMALVFPEGMGMVPGLLEATISEANGDGKVTKWIGCYYSGAE